VVKVKRLFVNDCEIFMSKNIDQYKIAIIGPNDVVSGFKVLGVESFVAHDSEEVVLQLKKIKHMTASGEENSVFAVVCIIEDLMHNIDEKEYAKAVSGALPAIVILPSSKGSQGLAEARLRKLAERAIGASII
jgi:V/A-type H+-transporting ATPase subunit F